MISWVWTTTISFYNDLSSCMFIFFEIILIKKNNITARILEHLLGTNILKCTYLLTSHGLHHYCYMNKIRTWSLNEWLLLVSDLTRNSYHFSKFFLGEAMKTLFHDFLLLWPNDLPKAHNSFKKKIWRTHTYRDDQDLVPWAIWNTW